MAEIVSADPLLQPFQLKHLTLRNRVMSTSHEPAYAEDGKPKLRYQLYHEEKARGGIALSMFGGSTNIDLDSPPVFGQLYAGDDDIIPYFRELAERVHRHGAATMVQLTHMGRRTVSDAGNWLPVVAPSSVREPSHRAFPKEMEDFDIRRIVSAYGQAARRARDGGLDGCEVIAYGHLIDQFWSPLTNQRSDRYGGSLENRMRFSLEVLAEIRAQVGDDFIVGIRMTCDEDVDGGLTAEDGISIARGLAQTGMIDFVNVIKGWIATDDSLAKVIPGLGTPLGPHLAFAGAIKDAVDIPVFQAARVADLETARYAIEAGYVDMVGMTRAHMADPHIVAKLAAGEAHRIRPCVGASYCINRLYLGHDALCIHNPATGREATVPHVVPPSSTGTRRVVVVGGGVAGLEAARVCAERGHDVELLEAAHELGGQVLLAARATDRRRDLIGIVDWLADEVHRAGVKVRLNTVADPDLVGGLDPDVVIVATGGWPRSGQFDGADLAHSVWDVIGGHARMSGSVLVFDDHGSDEAVSVAERLALEGHSVEIVAPERHVGFEVTGLAYPEYLRVLYGLGVVMTPDHRVVGASRTANRLTVELENLYTGSTIEREVDHLVVEHGTEPIADVYAGLRGRAVNRGEVDLAALVEGRPQEIVTNPDGEFRLFRIGDAVASRNIHAAIYDARRLCMTL